MDSINMLVDMVLISLSNVEIVSENDIDLSISELVKTNFFSNLNEEDIKKVKNIILSRLEIKVDNDVIILSNIDSDEWYNPSKVKHTFWDRYSKYLSNKGFSKSIINNLNYEVINSKFLNQLGNPNGIAFSKRGLVIGDVQSGKTSTYIGLMSKCADAGYKVFIILTGTIESLRSQTQKRVEDAFTQRDYATMLTSRKKDFNQNIKDITIQPDYNIPLVLVIKKNSKVLKSVSDWLSNNISYTNLPMLLIDDEADNASINTNKSKDSPTIINESIRKLLNMFNKCSYVGFTATPFANIFIDPISVHKENGYDLFPEDFIVSLSAPSNYIGAKKMFPEDSEYHSQLNFIEDIDENTTDNTKFTYRHSKDWDGILPDSLTDAIYTFYLANAIRDLDGYTDKPRSMLINISRFMDVQRNIEVKVNDILEKSRSAIQFDLNSDLEKCKQSPILERIYIVWQEQYENKCNYSWDDIQPVLFQSIESVEIKVVNSSKQSSKLDYDKNPSMRVIAIGGLALSRGLTLEGLMTTYFYRNTSTYDVLMQMGRWFGYRDGYETLFRVWTSRQSTEWYAKIAYATEDLKKDMEQMYKDNKKPKDFGIRVKKVSDKLKITATNKMRNALMVLKSNSYSSVVLETPYIYEDFQKQRYNYNAVCNLLNTCQLDENVAHDISKDSILELLSRLHFPGSNKKFNIEDICNIIGMDEPSLNFWDVAIIGGDGEFLPQFNIKKVVRNRCIIKNSEISIGRRGKVGGTSDGRFGLGKEQRDSITTRTSNAWFTIERKPLLMIYFLELYFEIEDIDTENLNNSLASNGVVPIAIGIGFPKNKNLEKGNERFAVNSEYNYYNEAMEE